MENELNQFEKDWEKKTIIWEKQSEECKMQLNQLKELAMLLKEKNELRDKEFELR